MKVNQLAWALQLLLMSGPAIQLPAQQTEADSKLLAEIKAKAEEGDAVAQLNLGTRYSAGHGVPQDYAEGFKWFHKAAEQGSPEAQFHLGLYYHLGHGVATNDAEGTKWCRKAADKGFAFAQVWLGMCYECGNGVTKDYLVAARWYRKAAEQTNAVGQSLLARCYEEGKGVPKDEIEAAAWLRKMTRNLRDNPEQASFFALVNRRLAEEGDAEAQHVLGLAYYHGFGVSQDHSEAARWFRKAADQSKPEAQVYFGRCYANGFGLPKDAVEAMKWYRRAAEQGEAEAQTLLGFSYAQTLLGQTFMIGEGVPQDYGQAVSWFRRAADQGDAMGQFALAACYWEGRGVPKNRVEAYKGLNLAAAQDGENFIGKAAAQAARARDALAATMIKEEIAEAQRLSAAFVARKESQVITRRRGFKFMTENLEHPRATGTGFFITEDGFLVTNEHVIRNATQIRLVTSKGVISTRVVKVDAANDLALLKAEAFAAPPPGFVLEHGYALKVSALPVAASRAVKLGGTVATVGFPNVGLQGFAPKLAKGEIASLSGAGDDARYFQISVPVQPGNSGGALVDERGNVVGVVSGKLNSAAALIATGALPENVNYAVKSSFLLGFLESLPELSTKLKEPNTKERNFEEVAKSAEQAAVMVLVY